MKTYRMTLRRMMMTVLMMLITVSAMSAEQKIWLHISGNGKAQVSLGETVLTFDKDNMTTVKEDAPGKTVTVSVKPDNGYTVSSVTAQLTTDAGNADTRGADDAGFLDVKKASDTEYTFEMPKDFNVRIYVTISKKESESKNQTFVLTTADDVTNGTEKLYWVENVGATGFYAVPHSNNTNASTTNAPTLRALWYFMASGEDGYYYIINKETGKYLKKTGKAGDDNTIGVADYVAADDVKFKFSFGTPEGITEGSWVIYPKDNSSNSKTGWLSKKSGNLVYPNWLKASIWGDTPVGDLNSQWKIVPRANVQWPQSGLPFVVSTSSDKHYYRINHAQSTDYNISYDDSNFAIISSDDDNKIAWYFEEAAADPNIDNLKYYNIVNVESGKYLKFTSTDQNINGKSQDDKVFKVLDFNAGDADRFQFVVVNSYGGNAGYSIMPKLAMSKYDVNNYANSMISSSVSNNDKLDLRSDRNNNNAHWTFRALWADPVVTCDENGTITITGEDGAAFYYTTDGSTVPTTENTQYDANNKPTISEGITTIQVRAIAAGKSDSRVITQKIVYVPNQTFAPSTYDKTTKTLAVTVGETTISSDEYNISYKMGGNDVTECKDAGTYTVEITDNNGGEYIVYGSGSFTINKKALTITAEAKSKTYGDADPELTYTSEGLVEGDVITGVLSREVGEIVGTYAITQGNLTAGDNYNISYTSANFTITPKALTITADSDSKEYDGTALTKNSYTNTDLATGDVITSVTVTGSQTDKGNSENVPSSAVIKNDNGNGTDVTGCYDITYANGTLTVTGRVITITADSETKVYDGTALIKDSYTCEGTMYSGDAIESVTVTGSQTVVGSSENVPSAAVIKNSGTDVTANYTITYANGTLEVTAKAVTITANDATKNYDGSALTEFGFDATALEDDDTHTFTIVMTAESTITNAGIQPNVIATVDGVSVTTGIETAVGNYLVTTANGTLEVTAKNVTIIADDASKVYNGTALTKNTFSASALETGDTHTFTVTMTPESTITNAGTQPNVIATVDGIAVTTGTATDVGNYKVTTVDGTLTINPKAVTITANDATKGYDRSALTETGFTASALEDGDTHTFTIVMTGESTITNAGTQPNVIATVDGVAVTTGIATDVGNYKVTTANGTLTINPKDLSSADITIGITKNGNAYTVTVKDGETELKTTDHYSLSVDETNPKYYVATATGKYDNTLNPPGNYTGTITAKYVNVAFSKKNPGDNTEKWSATFVIDSGEGKFSTPTGFTPHIVTAVNDGNVTLSAIDYIPEEVPVLLLSDSEAAGFVAQTAGDDDIDTSANKLLKANKSYPTEEPVGQYFGTGTIYLLYKGEFVLNMAGALTAGKVYLPKSSGAGTRLAIFESRTTDIKGATLKDKEEMMNDKWYSLDGRRLNGKPTKKGVYIINGKKSVVK